MTATDELRLRRRAVLRWVHGWWSHHGGEQPLPLALTDLHMELDA